MQFNTVKSVPASNMGQYDQCRFYCRAGRLAKHLVEMAEKAHRIATKQDRTRKYARRIVDGSSQFALFSLDTHIAHLHSPNRAHRSLTIAR